MGDISALPLELMVQVPQNIPNLVILRCFTEDGKEIYTEISQEHPELNLWTQKN